MAAEAGMQVGEILRIIGSVKPPGLKAWFQSSHRSSLFYIRSDARKRNAGSNFYQTVKNWHVAAENPADPEVLLFGKRDSRCDYGRSGLVGLNMSAFVNYILYSFCHVLYA